MTEEWRTVPGYEGLYAVSSIGRVKRLSHYSEFVMRGRLTKRLLPEKIMKLGVSTTCSKYDPDNRYLTVQLVKDGECKYPSVHQLVALAFVPNPEGKPFVNHKDGDKSNNCFTNLEWVTNQENQLHAWNNFIPDRLREEAADRMRRCNSGVKFSQEHKDKIAASLKGKKKSAEHCKHLSEAMKLRSLQTNENLR